MFDYNKLKDLYIPEEFGVDDYNEPTDSIDIVFDQVPATVITKWGVTQFVIIDPDTDNKKVAKIPFNGYFVTEEEYEGDPDAVYVFQKYRTNYCDLSYELYSEAEEKGLNDILAEFDYLGITSNGIPIYLQEKVTDMDESDFHYTITPESRKKYNELGSKNLSWYHFPTEWMIAAIDYYGVSFMADFIMFCEVHNLNDFHEGNVGWREDGSPCVLDWAGYNE